MSVLITCTSDNRPSNPSNGDLLYETDSNKLILWYDGWITYGQSNTSTGGETPTVLFTVGTSDDVALYTAESQTGDMFLDTSPGLNELNILTTTTSSVFVFDNLLSDSLADRFISTEKTRPSTQSIQQYLTGGNMLQVLSASDFTTTQSTPDVFYVYDNNLNNNHVFIFGKESALDDNVTTENNISVQVVDTTTTQEFSAQPIDHAFVTIDSTIHDIDTVGIYNSSNGCVFGKNINKLANKTSFNLTCSSDGTVNYSGRYISTGNAFVENYSGAYSLDMWFMLLPSLDTHIHRHLFGYSSSIIRCVIDSGGSYIDSTGTYFDNFQSTPGSITLNNWHRITNTRDSAGNGKIYLDGQLVHTYVMTSKIYIREIAGDTGYIYSNTYMHGYVYSVGAWKRDLSVDEINDMSDPINTHKHAPLFWLFPSIEKTSQSLDINKCRDVISPSAVATSLTQYQSDPTNTYINISTPDNYIPYEIYASVTPL